MISDIARWLKSAGIEPLQVDFGNFMVGLATVLVTGVSLYVALKATRGSNNQKVTEFRQLWIDDLRTHVSQFVGSVYETLNHSIRVHRRTVVSAISISSTVSLGDSSLMLP